MVSPPGLVLHHVGCVVECITESIERYKESLGFYEHSKIYDVSSQKVKVCFINTGNNTFLELVEPQDPQSSIAKLLKKRQSYYHIGYKTPHFDETFEHLSNTGAIMITLFHSEAFDNKRCAFFYTKELHMIEIIEN